KSTRNLAMRRDMDLIRELLLRLEGLPRDRMGGVYSIYAYDADFKGEGKTDEEVDYHFQLLRDSGLIDSPGSQPMDGITFSGLTWQGHDFVDAIREEKVWRLAREGALQAGGFSFDLVKELAKGFIRKQLEERTGIKL